MLQVIINSLLRRCGTERHSLGFYCSCKKGSNLAHCELWEELELFSREKWNNRWTLWSDTVHKYGALTGWKQRDPGFWGYIGSRVIKCWGESWEFKNPHLDVLFPLFSWHVCFKSFTGKCLHIKKWTYGSYKITNIRKREKNICFYLSFVFFFSFKFCDFDPHSSEKPFYICITAWDHIHIQLEIWLAVIILSAFHFLNVFINVQVD